MQNTDYYGECNIAWLKELPYYCVSKQEMENDMSKPVEGRFC